MKETVTRTGGGGLAVVRLGREHGNAISPQLVEDLQRHADAAAADTTVRGMLLAASGKLFCPGLDLQDLIELDRPTMGSFLKAFADVLLTLYTFPKPVVAAMHGHAVAGGYILSLTADWRVLRDGALIGLNEVKVGVPFPFGVSLMLRESLPPHRLEEVALYGRNYRGDEAIDAGLAHELHGEEGFEAHCLERLRELADKDARAFEMTKRYLRSAAVERIRGEDAARRDEWLDAWFSDGTRRRLEAIVSELKKR